MIPTKSCKFTRKRANIARSIAAILAGGSMLAASASEANAADASWTGATSGAWLTTTNWSPAAAPGSSVLNSTNADIATFSAAPNPVIGIDFSTTAGIYALGALDNTNATTRTINNSSITTAGVLTLNGATVNAIPDTIIRNAVGNTFTITNGAAAGTMGLRLGNTSNVIQITSTGGVTINSLISEKNAGSGLTLQGGGTGLLALSGANTYTGVTTVSTGTLEIRNASALGTTAGNTVVATGARIFAGASFTGLTTAEPFNIAGFGASSGAIHVGGSATGVGFSGAITLSGNATIQGDGNTGTTFSGGINLGANTLTFGVGGGANTTISTTGINGLGSVIKNSSTGTLNLNAANTYSGTTTIDGGVLSLGHLNALGGTSGITISGGATLTTQLTGMTISAPITLGAASTTSTVSFSRNLASVGSLALTGAISGAGDLVFTTPNVNSGGYVQSVILGAASSNTGTTTITSANVNNSVTVKAGVANSLSTSTILILNGGNGTGVGGRTVAYDLAGFNQSIAGLTNTTGLTLRNQRILNSTGTSATFEITGASSFSGEINGTNLNLTKSGTGTFATSGINGYTGSTKITGGILSLDNSLAMQNSALDTLNSLVGDATNGLQTTVTTLTMGGLTGNKNLADVFTTAGGGYSGVTALTLNPGIGATPSYSGNIADGGAGMTLTKTGTGLQTLAGANGFSGTTTINAGTLKLDYGTQDNSKLSDTAALILGGGTLDLSGGTHTEVVASTTLSAGTASNVTSSTPGAILEMNAITRNAGATINFGAANIATTDTLNVNGILGTWATINGTDWAVNSTNGANGLIAAATYTDVTRLNGGTQVIADGSSTNIRIIEGTGVAANITLGAATTTINSLNQSTVGGTSAATIDPAGQTLRTDGILVGTGAGGLTIGTGINNGILSTATAGSELQLNNNSVNGLTINSVVADNTTSALTKTGTGTVSLTGVNTYAGATQIAAGILNANSTDALGNSSATNTLIFTGGTLQASGTIASAATRSVTLTSTGLIDTNGNSVSIAGVISGVGGVTKSGPGTLSLSGVNTYNGATTISAGILNANSTDALGDSTATNTLVFTGGTLQAGGTITSANTRLVTLTSTGIIDTNGNSVSIAGDMSGAGGLTKIGTGTLTLTGANPFTGTTTIAAGILNANTTNALGDSSATNTLDFTGGTLQAGGAITSVASRLVSMTSTGIIDTNSNPVSIAGVISGPGGLTKIGADTLTLSAANTYLGTTTINAGTLALTGGNDRLATTGAMTVNGGTLDLGANNQTTSGIVSFLSGTTTNGTLIKSGADYDGQGGDVSAVLAGGVGLTKTTAGTLNLTGINTYSGATTINNGILNANSTSALGDSSATNTLVFTGGTLQAGGAITSLATRLVTLTSTGLIDTNGNAVSIAGVMSGAGGLTKNGAGTLTLTGVNTYSGATTIAAGTLNVSTTTGLGDSSATNTLIFTGGTLQAGATFTSAATRLVTLSSTGLINTNTFNVTIAGVMSGPGGVTKSSTGTLFLTAANTYSGPTSITGGTLNANSTSALGDGSGTNTLIFNAGTLQAGGTITSPATRGVTMTGAGTIDTNGNAVSIAGVISGSGALTKIGAGTLTLTAVNTRTGTTTINVGTLNANSSSALGSGVASNTLIFTGGTLQAGGNITSPSTRGVTLTNTGLINTNGFNVSIAGVMSGAGGVTKSGLGSLTLSGVNTYSGATTIGAGTLIANATTGLGNSSATNTLIFTGGTLQAGGAITSAATRLVTLTSTGLIDTNGNNVSIAGIMSGAGGVTKSGAGNLTLSGVNTYSGATTIGAGTLIANATTGLGNSSATNTLIFTGGTLQAGGAITSAATRLVTLTSTGIINTNGNAVSIAGIMSGAGGLTKNGTGTLTLTAANTYLGTTTISAGTLALSGGNNRLATTGAISVNGGTLDLGANSQSTSGIVSFLSGSTTNGTLTKSGADYDGQAGTVSAILAGAVGLNKSTAGILTLSGVNTYSGATTISAGTLIANATTGLGNSSATNTLIFTGGTLQAGGTIASAATRLVTLTSTGLIDTNSNNVSIAGIMSGPGGLTKNGLGNLTLTGANTYAGTTTVNAGTLFVNNTIGFGTADVVLAGPGTLGGSGFISGNVTGSGTVAPGNSVGPLTVAGNYNVTGTHQFEINDVLNSFDEVVGINALTYAGTLNVTNTGAGTNYFVGQQFDLFDFTSQSGTFSTINLPTLPGPLTWKNFGGSNFDYANGLIEVVPEPSTLVLGSLFGLGLLAHGIRRRRQAKAA